MHPLGYAWKAIEEGAEDHRAWFDGIDAIYSNTHLHGGRKAQGSRRQFEL